MSRARPPLRKTQAIVWLAHAAVVALIHNHVDRIVPEPYMDEIFHITQAQTYCQGRWHVWDAKLTTPPGLYILPAIFGRYLHLPTCSVSSLRANNAIIVAFLPLLLADILRKIRRPIQPVQSWPIVEATVISAFPLLYFFAFLYYTDVASVALVLLSYRFSLSGKHTISAAIGLVSLLFRQTNILWVAFVAFTALQARLLQPSHIENVRDLEVLSQYSLTGLFRAGLLLVRSILSNVPAALPLVAAYGMVAVCFGAFLRWNGGIVLGDKTMHVAVIHAVQLHYFAFFSSAFLAPLLLGTRNIRQAVASLLCSPSRILASGLATAFIVWTIQRFTVVHPFLLADNRHYPFYVWRRLLNFHPHARYLLAPAYTVCYSILYRAIRQARIWSNLSTVVFVIVAAVTVIPSPLLEFRYFILPYVLLRLHLVPKQRGRIAVEYALYVATNLATLYLFLYRPFRWPTEAGWQRFMW